MRVSRNTATSFGILAIIFWSTTVAFARSLANALGAITSAAAIFTISGVVGCAWLLRSGRWREIPRLPRSFLFVCGGLFVAYMLCLYLAVGLAATDAQVVEVGVINYLWPGLTLGLAVPILGHKARWTLWPGLIAGFFGAGLASTGANGLSWQGVLDNAIAHPVPYLLALAAALSWALYSNLSRKWANTAPGHTVPIFLLAAGIAFLILRTLFHEAVHWTPRTGWELAYMILVPTLLAYAFWDVSVRRGNIILVAALSYATPILSTVISCVYLGVSPGWTLWAGCVLVTGGAGIARRSVSDPE